MMASLPPLNPTPLLSPKLTITLYDIYFRKQAKTELKRQFPTWPVYDGIKLGLENVLFRSLPFIRLLHTHKCNLSDLGFLQRTQ
jgi:hypothetical protein